MADNEPQMIGPESNYSSAEGSVTTSSLELKIDALTQSVGRLVQCLSSEADLSQREEELLLASEEDYDPTRSLTDDDVHVAGQPEKDSVLRPDSDLFNDPDQCGQETSKELPTASTWLVLKSQLKMNWVKFKSAIYARKIVQCS